MRHFLQNFETNTLITGTHFHLSKFKIFSVSEGRKKRARCNFLDLGRVKLSAFERTDPTRLPKVMIHWKPEGRKQRGRPGELGRWNVYSHE
jgi:hypothetical protein